VFGVKACYSRDAKAETESFRSERVYVLRSTVGWHSPHDVATIVQNALLYAERN